MSSTHGFDSYAPLLFDLSFVLKDGREVVIKATDILQSISIEASEKSFWSGQIVLFDYEFEYLENVLLSLGPERYMRFKWGWDVGRNTTEFPLYYGRIMKITPSYTHEGATFTLDLLQAEPPVALFDRPPLSWPAGMTASDIVRELASQYGWKTVDPNGRQTIQDSVGTLGELSLSGESAYKFARESLLPKARDTDGNAFSMFWRVSGEVHFHTPNYLDKEIAARYTFARSVMGDVISFSPTDESAFEAIYNRGKTVFYGFDSKTGEKLEIETDKDGHVPGTSPTVVKDAKHYRDTPGDVTRRVYVSARDAEEFEHLVYTRMRDFSTATYRASMEVRGTHNVQQLDLVEVQYFKGNGQPHYLSGIYTVHKVEQKLDAGGWTTTFELLREGTKAPTPDAPKHEQTKTLNPKDKTNVQDEQKAAIQRALAGIQGQKIEVTELKIPESL
jgi:hypothetical protein